MILISFLIFFYHHISFRDSSLLNDGWIPNLENERTESQWNGNMDGLSSSSQLGFIRRDYSNPQNTDDRDENDNIQSSEKSIRRSSISSSSLGQSKEKFDQINDQDLMHLYQDTGSGINRGVLGDAGNHKYASLKYGMMDQNETKLDNNVLEGQLVYSSEAHNQQNQRESSSSVPADVRDVIFNKIRRLSGLHPTLILKVVKEDDDRDSNEEDDDDDAEENASEIDEDVNKVDSEADKKKKQRKKDGDKEERKEETNDDDDGKEKEPGHHHHHHHNEESSDKYSEDSKKNQNHESLDNSHGLSNHKIKQNGDSQKSNSEDQSKDSKPTGRISSGPMKPSLSTGPSEEGIHDPSNAKNTPVIAGMSTSKQASSTVGNIKSRAIEPGTERKFVKDETNAHVELVHRRSSRLKSLYESYAHRKRDSVLKAGEEEKNNSMNQSSPPPPPAGLQDVSVQAENNKTANNQTDVIVTTHDVTGEVMGYLTQLKELIKNSVSNDTETVSSSKHDTTPTKNSTIFQKLWSRLSNAIQNIFPHPESNKGLKENDDETRSTITKHGAPENRSKLKPRKEAHHKHKKPSVRRKKHLKRGNRIYKRSTVSVFDGQDDREESKRGNEYGREILNKNRFGRNTVKKMLVIDDQKSAAKPIVLKRKTLSSKDPGMRRSHRKAIRNQKRMEIQSSPTSSSSFKEFSQSLDKMIDDMFKSHDVENVNRNQNILSEKHSSFGNPRETSSRELPINSVDSSNWDDSTDYERSMGISDDEVMPFTSEHNMDPEKNGFQRNGETLHTEKWPEYRHIPIKFPMSDNEHTIAVTPITVSPPIQMSMPQQTPSTYVPQSILVSENHDDDANHIASDTNDHTRNISSFTVKTWNNSSNVTIGGIEGSIYSPQANLTLEIRPEITISVKNTQINNPRSVLQPKVIEYTERSYDDNPTYKAYQKYYRSYYGLDNNTTNESINEKNDQQENLDGIRLNFTSPPLLFVPENQSIIFNTTKNNSPHPTFTAIISKASQSPYIGPVIPADIQVFADEINEDDISNSTESLTPLTTQKPNDDKLDSDLEDDNDDEVQSATLADSKLTKSDETLTTEKPSEKKENPGQRRDSKFSDRPIDRFLKMLKSFRDGNVHDKKSYL